MWIFIFGLGILLVTGIFAFVFTKMQKKEEEEVEIPSDCCGAHAVCERDRLLVSANEIIYFDDEELDVLSGIDADNYTPQQVKEISEVFYSLREIDVAGWLRSLQLRNIQLPESVKEEALLVVSERRRIERI
ncbi:MAG: phospholipase [Paludibacteraceae bacterium]|nr:phospholipase [Paludibacteraceae bacterium]MBO7316036.1 phospholipase [Paludibacteraceae bacterium]